MMSSRRFDSLLAVVCLIVLSRGVLAEENGDAGVVQGGIGGEGIDFAHDVAPVLQQNCVHCHGGQIAEGGFSLNTRELLVDSGYVDLDDPEYSYLITLITSDDPDLQMPPPERPRMSDEEISILKNWVTAKLPWEPGMSFALDAYEPPLRPREPTLPPVHGGRENPIDRILDRDLLSRGAAIPQPIDDLVFLRRASLDLVGLLPSEQQFRDFVDDSAPDKRARLIDELLADDVGYADHWITFFNDLLRNDYSGTGFITGGRRQISGWLYDALLHNKPFDQLTRELISPPTPDSRGYIDGIKWRGEVSAGQTIPIQFSQSISQSFLGINMKCASCHDSFVDRWKLTDAYGLAAIYADEPLELHRCDKPIGQTAQAAWLFPELGQVDSDAPRSERLRQLAELMTDPQNGRFARTIVNRLWYRMMGRGIVHPLDAMQNEPWNEDLLDFLANELVENDFDLKAVLRLIARSEAYQSVAQIKAGQGVDGQTGEDRDEDVAQQNVAEQVAAEVSSGHSASGLGVGQYEYQGPLARRMTAEQFVDAIWHLTNASPQTVEAPLMRFDPARLSSVDVEPAHDWIWAANQTANQAAADGNRDNVSGNVDQDTDPNTDQDIKSIALEKKFRLASPAVSGAAVLICDGSYTLFVNGKKVDQSTDPLTPNWISLAGNLRQGENSLVVVVKASEERPDQAGFWMDLRVKLADETMFEIGTDPTWSFCLDPPARLGSRLGKMGDKRDPVSVLPVVGRWQDVVETSALPIIKTIAASNQQDRMVRASLRKNTPLMKSLGRPMREQIVSMRPDTITTLEAIDLANESTLADWFADGARRLNAKCQRDTDRIIDTLFQSALCRSATADERTIVANMLGSDPSDSDVQDVMWAVCMLPEFMLIR